MPQLKAQRGKHFIGDMRTRSRVAPLSALDDRTRLIRECLRDLKDVELIYAIRCQDGAIKIGWTKNINLRRKGLDTTFEALLAVRPGTYDEEQALHDQLHASVAHGREYYHPTPDVLAYVNSLRQALGIQPVS